MSQGFQIVLVAAPTNEVSTLIGELNEELSALYTPEQRHGLSLDAILQPHVRFFVAWLDNVPVGCGGIALLGGFAEMKRLYVRPEFRGKGIAEAIVSKLAEETVKSGRTLLRLETGSQFLNLPASALVKPGALLQLLPGASEPPST